MPDTTQPPNFLFLFPDQWRWDWIGCEESPYGKVPVRVPLIVAGPGVMGRRNSNEPVELIDIAATFLEAAGIECPTAWDSCSFGPLLRDPDRQHRDFTISQWGDWRSITDRRWKWISFRDGGAKLFDLERDPAELNSVAAAHPEVVSRLNAILEAKNPWFTDAVG